MVGCASRTAPWNLLLGPMPAAAAAALAPAVVAADPQVPGIVALDEVAQAFAAALPDRRLDLTMREVVRVLDELVEPVDVPGLPQVAGRTELPVLVDWYRQFAADAGLPLHDVEQSVRDAAERGRAAVVGRSTVSTSRWPGTPRPSRYRVARSAGSVRCTRRPSTAGTGTRRR